MNARDDLEAARQACAAVGEAELVVLFGSVARGDARTWSDVDVGVLGLPFWAAQKLGVNVGRAVGRSPHVADLATASDRLRYEISREGVLVHEYETGAWARFQAEAAIRWFDLAPLVARCVAGARRRLVAEARRG